MSRRQRNKNKAENISRRKSHRALRKRSDSPFQDHSTIREWATASRVSVTSVLNLGAASATICLTFGCASFIKAPLDSIISLVPYIPMVEFVISDVLLQKKCTLVFHFLNFVVSALHLPNIC